MTRFGRQNLTRLGGRTAWAARAVGARLRNEVAAGGFAERAGVNGLVPNAGIAVFFATGPENLYQFEQWRLPLEHLAQQRPLFVIVDRPDTGDLVLRGTGLPVAFARGSLALEELVAERDVRVVLYLNQIESNFRMLRFASPVHIQIGHGESDKGGSVSNQHKAYDLTFVGGDAGRDRLSQALRGFDGGSARSLLAVRSSTMATLALRRGHGIRVYGCGTRPPGRGTGQASRTGR